MKIEVRYYTRSGNTKKLAQAIAQAVGTECCDTKQPLTEKTDVLFLGSSMYAGGVDEEIKTFLKNNADKIGIVVNFSTSALAGSTAKQIKKLADEYKIAVSEQEFYCHGSFLFMHKGRPNCQDLQKAADFAENFVKSL